MTGSNSEPLGPGRKRLLREDPCAEPALIMHEPGSRGRSSEAGGGEIHADSRTGLVSTALTQATENITAPVFVLADGDTSKTATHTGHDVCPRLTRERIMEP